MIAVSAFFQEASELLCGTLDFRQALESFFPYLQKNIPVTRFGLGRRNPGQYSQEVVAMCGPGEGIIMGNREMALYTPEQQRLLPEFRNMQLSQGEYLVNDYSHLAARFYAAGSQDFYKPLPPFFGLQLQYGAAIVGAAIFECSADKPFNAAELELLRALRSPLRIMLSNCFQHRELQDLKDQIWQENKKLQLELSGLSQVEVVGARGDLADLLRRAQLAAAVNVPVLIGGETGSGKELIARAVHDFSPRRGAAFVAVNCGGIPPSLIDSELFGHVKGAFTGAINNHKGRFERAHQGTLFLDEIGELPLDIQARLLRVLQDGVIERVGGSASIPVDFRLVAATNRDLATMVHEGSFREDLFYRLNVVSLYVPPLRERLRDIPLLVDHCIRRGANKFGILAPDIATGEMEKMLAYAWPGNVRELQNVVEQALVLMPRGPLHFQCGVDHKQARRDPSPNPLPLDWEQMQTYYFQHLLEKSQGRITGRNGAVALSGLKASTLRSKMDKLQLAYGRKS